jgi:hypothetical protein
MYKMASFTSPLGMVTQSHRLQLLAPLKTLHPVQSEPCYTSDTSLRNVAVTARIVVEGLQSRHRLITAPGSEVGARQLL